ncbi:hypothetical protein AN958_04311 [Leucoagaricus sp. SymC.cos]|nr:hypothetical protein AN958_04311 [Leucoagaricus sp. SymC.cos]
MSDPPPAGTSFHSDQLLERLHALLSSGHVPPATPSSSTGLPGQPPGLTVLLTAKAGATAPFPRVPLPGPHLLRPTALPQPSAPLGPYLLALEEELVDPQVNFEVRHLGFILPRHEPTAPPVEIVSPEAAWMDVAPPPPSVPDCLPENALVGEPSGTVPAPSPPKPQGLRKAKAKKAAEKWVLSKGPPPPILSASKPGTQSFAAAAQAAPAPFVGSSGLVENLVHVTRSFPNLAPSAIAALLRADTAAAASAAPAPAGVAGAKRPITPSAPASSAKKPKATTKGPSRKQVLFVLDDPNARPNLEQMLHLLNKYLMDNRVIRLHAESVLVVYSGWSIRITDVPSLEQLNAICQWLGIHFSPVSSEAYLPTSKSFLKLVDVPYICQDGSRTTSDQVKGVMRASNLSNHFILMGPPWVVCNSKSSDTVTAYFKVWDSQRGTRAANLVGHSLQLGRSIEKVWSAVIDTLRYHSLPVTLETFKPDASDAHPGRWLLDCFGDRVQIVEFDSKEEDVNVLRILNMELDKASALDDCIVAATDASVGHDRAFQVVSAAWVWAGRMPVWQSRQAAGRVTAPDVELHAIQMGVFAACAQEGACHVVLFTNHLALARQAVDPSVGSGQAQALLICRRLQKWLGEDLSHTFAFIQVCSSLEWPLHHVVHCFATDPSFKVLVGDSLFTTLNYIRMAEAQACHDEWTRQFTSSSSSRRDFLHLTDVRGK